MAGFVGFPKHVLNPKTPAQERAGNYGGKFLDDHFQGLFLGGVVKRAVATSTITAQSGGVFGSGTATIYAFSSDTPDGPPTLISYDETIYNPNGIAYSTGASLNVIDTGRFFIIAGSGESTIRPVLNLTATTVTLTTAQFNAIITNTGSAAPQTFTLPTAAELVAAIPNAQIGSSFDVILMPTQSGNTMTLAAGTGGAFLDASGNKVANNLHVAEIFIVSLTAVSSGTEAYKIVGLYS